MSNKKIRVEKGETVLSQNQSADHLFFVVKGELTHYKKNNLSLGKKELNQVKPELESYFTVASSVQFDVVGEESLFERERKYEYTVTCKSAHATLLKVSRSIIFMMPKDILKSISTMFEKKQEFRTNQINIQIKRDNPMKVSVVRKENKNVDSSNLFFQIQTKFKDVGKTLAIINCIKGKQKESKCNEKERKNLIIKKNIEVLNKRSIFERKIKNEARPFFKLQTDVLKEWSIVKKQENKMVESKHLLFIQKLSSAIASERVSIFKTLNKHIFSKKESIN